MQKTTQHRASSAQLVGEGFLFAGGSWGRPGPGHGASPRDARSRARQVYRLQQPVRALLENGAEIAVFWCPPRGVRGPGRAAGDGARWPASSSSHWPALRTYCKESTMCRRKRRQPKVGWRRPPTSGCPSHIARSLSAATLSWHGFGAPAHRPSRSQRSRARAPASPHVFTQRTTRLTTTRLLHLKAMTRHAFAPPLLEPSAEASLRALRTTRCAGLLDLSVAEMLARAAAVQSYLAVRLFWPLAACRIAAATGHWPNAPPDDPVRRRPPNAAAARQIGLPLRLLVAGHLSRSDADPGA